MWQCFPLGAHINVYLHVHLVLKIKTWFNYMISCKVVIRTVRWVEMSEGFPQVRYSLYWLDVFLWWPSQAKTASYCMFHHTLVLSFTTTGVWSFKEKTGWLHLKDLELLGVCIWLLYVYKVDINNGCVIRTGSHSIKSQFTSLKVVCAGFCLFCYQKVEVWCGMF